MYRRVVYGSTLSIVVESGIGTLHHKTSSRGRQGLGRGIVSKDRQDPRFAIGLVAYGDSRYVYYCCSDGSVVMSGLFRRPRGRASPEGRNCKYLDVGRVRWARYMADGLRRRRRGLRENRYGERRERRVPAGWTEGGVIVWRTIGKAEARGSDWETAGDKAWPSVERRREEASFWEPSRWWY